MKKHGPIDDKLHHGPYSMDYVVLDTVDTMDNTDPQFDDNVCIIGVILH